MSLTADTAFDLEAEIVRHCAGQRASWVPLAGALFRFHSEQAWKLRGFESFNEWLGQPEVGLARAEAYAMIAAWRELVVERELDWRQLTDLDVSKVAVVLPAIRSGATDLEDALSDCEALSRSDLRAKYQSPSAAEYRVCDACGSRVKVEG